MHHFYNFLLRSAAVTIDHCSSLQPARCCQQETQARKQLITLNRSYFAHLLPFLLVEAIRSSFYPDNSHNDFFKVSPVEVLDFLLGAQKSTDT